MDQNSIDQLSQNDLIDWLSKPAAYDRPVKKVKTISTHISKIFLAGDRAYKLKRAVKYPYLDFSTADKRRRACENEINLNRRTAPQVYLGLIPVTFDDEEGFKLDGRGKIVDWLIEMVRFKQSHIFDSLAQKGKLTKSLMEELAETIFQFHQSAEIDHSSNGADAVENVVRNNIASFSHLDDSFFDTQAVMRLDAATNELLDTMRPILQARALAGQVRHCHGDLHLRNIVMLDGRPALFDAIEFNDDFARIDVMFDLAFLLMDLEFQDMRPSANIVLNRYLELSGDIDALSCLPIFLSLRAAIRAHVTATASTFASGRKYQHMLGDARHYLDLANGYLMPEQPRLIAIGGLSGTGKSRLSRKLAPYLDPAPGAVVVRSDVLRKQLSGVDLHSKLSHEGYSEEMTVQTYNALYDKAHEALQAGHSVVADAVFAKPSQRDAIGKVARRHNIKFDGIWLEADQDVLEKRVAGRRNNVSDATVDVLRQQLTYDLGGIDWTRRSSSGPRKEVLGNVLSLLDI